MARFGIYFQDIKCTPTFGNCVDSNNVDQNDGQILQGDLNGNSENDQAECLKRCRAVPGVTGCELVPPGPCHGYGCVAHTREVVKGSGWKRFFCWAFSKCDDGNFTYFAIYLIDN